MRFLATCRSSTSNNIFIELTIIAIIIDTNCLKKIKQNLLYEVPSDVSLLNLKQYIHRIDDN